VPPLENLSLFQKVGIRCAEAAGIERKHYEKQTHIPKIVSSNGAVSRGPHGLHHCLAPRRAGIGPFCDFFNPRPLILGRAAVAEFPTR
jgi:hypothetical protein